MKVSMIKNKWFIDSGGTSHMTNCKILFSKLSNQDKFPTVSVGNGYKTSVAGRGTIQGIANFDETERQMRLKRTLYIPDLMCSPLSVRCIRRAGFCVMFEEDIEGNGICLINQPGVTDIVLLGIEGEDGLYEGGHLSSE